MDVFNGYYGKARNGWRKMKCEMRENRNSTRCTKFDSSKLTKSGRTGSIKEGGEANLVEELVGGKRKDTNHKCMTHKETPVPSGVIYCMSKL
jgi:hypothetical protein